MNNPPCIRYQMPSSGEIWCTEHLCSPGAFLDILSLTGQEGGHMALEREMAAECELCITWQQRRNL